MTLFRRDDLPLGFDFVGLDEDDLSDLTELVERHGGKIVHDDNLPIKFTKRAQFVSDAFPKFKLYDVEFIRECVRMSGIVDPTPFRIGKPMLYDNCIMLHYLKGSYSCCPTVNKIKVEDKTLMDNRTMHLVVRRLPGRPRKNGFKRLSMPETDCNERFKTSSPENIIMLTTGSQQSDTSDDEMMLSVAKKRRGRGPAFTFDEEEEMIKFLLRGKKVHSSATGPTIWEGMGRDGLLPHRTAMSLYKHYTNIMLPNIERHELTAKQLMMFKEVRESSDCSVKKENLNYSLRSS